MIVSLKALGANAYNRYAICPSEHINVFLRFGKNKLDFFKKDFIQVLRFTHAQLPYS